MTKILVAGGAGFLGSHVCEALLALGHEVVCVDNFHTGTRANVAPLQAQRGFALHEHDVENPLPEALCDGVGEIYHLACPASPAHYLRARVKTLRTNFLGAQNLLEVAHARGARLLAVSTSEVYGDALVHPQHESYWGHVNPIGVRACYDEGKRVAEALYYSYRAEVGVDLRVARVFNTYGPRMQENDGRVVSNFIVQALRGEALTIYGNGQQTRSFCYVSDLVRGLLALMACTAPLAAEAPVNLGNPAEVTVRAVAEAVRELTGKDVPITECPLPQDDPRRRLPDIGRAEALFGFAPAVTLREGLTRTIAYFAGRM